MLETALIVTVLCILVFIVGGLFFGIPQKYLKPLLLVSLLLVLVYLLWNLPISVIGICLITALVIAARLMFGRVP